MATLQHSPRKDKLSRVVTFDDQLWPVNLAIAILASFAAGALIATGRFDDPRPLANVWTHVALLAAGMLFVMWCVSKIDRRRVRRGLQLAMLVSLILHLLFVVVLQNQRLNLWAEQPPRVPRPVELPVVFVAPDYAFRTPGAAVFEQVEPAPTIAPEPESSSIARLQPQSLAALPLDSPPAPVPPAVSDFPPSVAEVRDRDDAAGQAADRAPLLSKRAPAEVQFDKPVAESLPQVEAAPEAAPLEPRSVALAPPSPSSAGAAEPTRPAAPMMTPAEDPRRFEQAAVKPGIADRLDAAETRVPDRVTAMPRRSARIDIAPVVTGTPSPVDVEPSTTASKVEMSTAPVPAETPIGRGPVAANLPERPAAPDGVGAPGVALRPGLGPLGVRAAEDHDLPRAGGERLLARRTLLPPAIDGRLREPAPAFARRGGQRRNPKGNDEFSQGSEAAIELGLDFLARHQAADGSWKLNFAGPGMPGSEERAAFRSDSAATGLALLSFLGAGYDHYGGAHQAVVQRALNYLLKIQKQNGDLYQPLDAASNKSAWLYSHGIASIALCEAYGMTGDPALAGAAQRAVSFIAASQDPKQGAWRYAPGSGSDTSVSGWQLMALKSGELAGLNVPAGTYQKITQWLDGAQAPGSQFVYNPTAPNTPEQRHGRQPTPSMTAVGLLMRLYTGWNRNDPRMIEGAESLLRKLPERGTTTQPARDTYYWYYATQVMFHMRGKYWQAWNERLHPLLIGEQISSGPLAGSWDPLKPVPDRWGPQGGRIYVTALNLLSLEVFYRHLPIFESTAK